MDDDRIHLFVGAARDNIPLASAAYQHLNLDHLDATLWEEGIDRVGREAMQTFTHAVREFDAGALVLTAEDVQLPSTDERARGRRDALIYHVGALMGHLGPQRVFVCLPSDGPPLPRVAEWLRVGCPHYELHHREGLFAGLRGACAEIRKALLPLGPLPHVPSRLPKPPAAPPTDPVSALAAWLKQQADPTPAQIIPFTEVEAQLGLSPGAARQYFVVAARQSGYHLVALTETGVRVRRQVPEAERLRMVRRDFIDAYSNYP